MNCKQATESYETWLAKRTRIVKADLRLKHQQMSADIFSFMRATFYRWLELSSEACADLVSAPVVLAVGDLHVENFGTWRDQEGRLVWGVNDFDEAFAKMHEMTLDLGFACPPQIGAFDRRALERTVAEDHFVRADDFGVLERKRIERTAEFVFWQQQRSRDPFPLPRVGSGGTAGLVNDQ